VIIRAEQMKHFDTLAQAAFRKRLAAYIREKHCEKIVQVHGDRLRVDTIPADRLEAMVGGGIGRAQSYGMSWQCALASFVVVMFMATPNFDDDPGIRTFLEDEDIEPNYRIDTVCRRVTPEKWNEIRQKYDATRWSLQNPAL
jgi:hypothetical protein